MKVTTLAILCCISLCSVFKAVFSNSSADHKCERLANTPFDVCTSAGYNYTLPLPRKLTGRLKDGISLFVEHTIASWENCSDLNLAATMECSALFPKCSGDGKRVLPCKRVCGEFLKQCINTASGFNALHLDYLLSMCHILPEYEKSNDEKCYEPPNFRTDDRIPSPLDRGCQELIIPACKDLGVYSHTLLSESVQKHLYMTFWGKSYNKSDLERDFPVMVEDTFAKYPKCRRNVEKLFCGDLFPPCFLSEPKTVFKTLCRSVCNDIARDCPGYFSDEFSIYDAEYCGSLPEGDTGDTICDLKEWPSPFHWLDYLGRLTTTSPPSKEPDKQGPKGWVIAVAVVSCLAVVGLVLGGLIWWKWRMTSPGVAYEKQHDEEGAQ